MKDVKKTCSRGHIFYKSSDCPVCPKCWSGFYRQKKQSDFPIKLSAPALRALRSVKIANLKQVSQWTKKDLTDIYGMGPTGITLLQRSMKSKKLSFRK